VKLLNLHQQHIAYQFDSYCKKVLKYYARDYIAKKQRDEQRMSFFEFSENELTGLTVSDKYFKGAYYFNVLDYKISVSDETLAEALQALPADRRDIVLLSFYLDMSDNEIAKLMNLVRRTVTYRKNATLKKLKIIMEGQAHE
jgi:RNA polymerase sigma factor (sigma-70 family)